MKDFIHDLYMRMGYPRASAFKTVLDMSLKDGRIVEILDRSRKMEHRRAAVKKRYESGDKFQAIEESLGLNVDLQ